ncbi:MAG: Molybdenum cofactor biosynthesis protein MoaA [Myxococcaceae bacterium]|nr:Molybdenum cofactor biosynthesis protein MoaA [Myxococcaceae bacterium]
MGWKRTCLQKSASPLTNHTGWVDSLARCPHLYRVARHLHVLGTHARGDLVAEGGGPLARDVAVPDAFGRDGLPALIDTQGRRYSYLRLSITDRCDFACVYCMPPGGEEDHAVRPDLLTFEEAGRLVSVFAQMGIDRVRFTGGEPLVRRDVVRLVELVERRSGVTNLVMTTNASRLAELALLLRRAGLRGVNISLDSLDPERFRSITRGGDLSRVLAGVHAALEAKLEVKLNIVAMGGVNDDEAGRLVDWAWDLGITPRFIELMPLGEASTLPAERFVSHQALRARLGTRLVEAVDGASIEGQGPARYLHGRAGAARKVGFITAVSNEFCGSCNRVRLTARGDFRACLASRNAVSLRDAVRAGKDDRTLAWLIHRALGTKLAGHFFDRPDVDEHRHVGMSLVGG